MAKKKRARYVSADLMSAATLAMFMGGLSMAEVGQVLGIHKDEVEKIIRSRMRVR